jgi:hypothetical protein
MPTDPKNQNKFKLIADRNCQLIGELRRRVAVMEALKAFIRRRIAIRKAETRVLRVISRRLSFSEPTVPKRLASLRRRGQGSDF